MSNRKPSPSLSSSRVGSALGSFAKRFGEIVTEVSQTVTVPEDLRRALEECRRLRTQGRFRAAIVPLDALSESQQAEASVVAARILTYFHARYLAAQSSIDLPSGAFESFKHLVAADRSLTDGLQEAALDSVRRQLRQTPKLSASDSAELAAICSAMLVQIYLLLGAPSRAQRELATVESYGRNMGWVMLHTRELTTKTQLAVGASAYGARDSYERNTQDLDALLLTLDDDQRSPLAEQKSRQEPTLLAMLAAADCDKTSLASALKKIEEPKQRAQTSFLANLAMATADDAMLKAIRSDEDAAELLPAGRERLIALTHLYGRLHASKEADVSLSLRLLAQLAQHGRGQQREQAQQEWALAYLAVGSSTTQENFPFEFDTQATVVELRVLAQLHSPDCSPELLTRLLAQTRSHLAGGKAAGTVEGGDVYSPLRHLELRERILCGAIHRALSQSLAKLGRQEEALTQLADANIYLREQQQFVEHLRILLAQENKDPIVQTRTLIDWMYPDATLEQRKHLSACRQRVEEELTRARRPFQIAIVGEFSSGKSSVVNAILGETLSPVGVLPTTSTILRFSSGQRPSRIIDRAGHIQTIDSAQTATYLQTLAPQEAELLTSVDVFGQWDNLGDVALIDTPGLNSDEEGHDKTSRELVERADALVWVFSATKVGTSHELETVREWMAQGHEVVAVINKCDALEEDEIAQVVGRAQELLPGVTIVPTTMMGERIIPGASSSSVNALVAAIRNQLIEKRTRITTRISRLRVRQALVELQRALTAELHLPAATEQAESAAASAKRIVPDLITPIVDLADYCTRELLALGLHDDERDRTRIDDWQDLVDIIRNVVMRTLLAQLHDAPTTSDIEGIERMAFLTWTNGLWQGLSHYEQLAADLRESLASEEPSEQNLRAQMSQWLRDLALRLQSELVTRMSQRHHEIVVDETRQRHHLRVLRSQHAWLPIIEHLTQPLGELQ